MPRTMRAAVLEPGGEVVVQEVAVPEPGPGEALVRLHACGICGSDVMGWYASRKAPFVFGHEPAGEVAVAGRGAALPEGTRVFPHHHAPCMACRACRAGRYVHCETWRRTRLVPGGMAEYVVVPQPNLERDTLVLPDGLSYEAATFVEPLACCWKAARRASVGRGDRVLVVGAGSMGLLLGLLSRHLGAETVAAADLVPSRLERARVLFAERAFDVRERPLTDAAREATGEGYDVVFVTPGTVEAIESGIGAAAPGGRVVVYAPTPPEARLGLDVHDLFFREVTVVPSYSAGPDDTRAALDLLERGVIPAGELISHRYPLERAAEAYRQAASPDAVKVVVVMGGA